MKRFTITCVCVISFLLVDPIYNAPSPRHRNRDRSSTTFDQTQSGDYNVQLHLKDFHIIAVLGDDSWGSLGDYDYNYDYSDLTIKPIVPATSEQPPASSSVSPDMESSPNDVSNATSTTKVSSEQQSSTESVLSSTTPKPIETTKSEPITNVSLIPVKIITDGDSDHPLPPGEILHYRKCTEGYSRDAQGRCRKIVRKSSQLPFGITRFAASLASKIRRIGSATS
ncbi:hypothetical protein PPYR_11232 [Photinus pyralis]|uniref:Uncharacterized protein n=1 Tax=Photinus pyralis TaxID=7054 RepID=A0A5N4AAP6_PHOPY|nr:uncharacterized protein LOC116177383 [Photinus pyralis]KAB0794393.1 hypothetical protein PPYR_11232 [Photinus pyralis]